MLLAEELLLLVTDNISGRLRAPAAQLDVVLGGANLVELTLMNKVDLSGQWDPGKPGRLIVRDFSPAGDEVLDAALKIVGTYQGKKPSTAIRPLAKGLRRTLYERLALAGTVRAEQGRVLGLFSAYTWPVHDASHKAQVCSLVTQALVRQTAPKAPSAALVALVHALRYEHKIVDPRECGMTRQQLGARAEQIAEGGWAPEAIRHATSEMIAAIVAATSAAAAAGSVTWG
jgi:Golgi phosphoprotein 3 (GPP34)